MYDRFFTIDQGAKYGELLNIVGLSVMIRHEAVTGFNLAVSNSNAYGRHSHK